MDVFSSSKRSEVMGKIRARHTKPEIMVRSALHKCGFRFRLHSAALPGTPDLVLSRYRTVIQIRGCFWHQHNCIDGHHPHTRRMYWIPKLQRNVERDIENDRKLRRLGWSVLVIWECRCNSSKNLEKEISRISRFLLRKRSR